MIYDTKSMQYAQHNSMVFILQDKRQFGVKYVSLIWKGNTINVLIVYFKYVPLSMEQFVFW